MAIEKERKFLLKDNKLPTGLHPVYIQQGYLMKEQKQHLRVRLMNGFSGMVAYKHDINKEERYEFEFGTNKADATKLLELCQTKVEKLRYSTKFKGNQVDIDVYVSANGVVFDEGLAVVEIEFENVLTDLPDYCGKEVTGKKEYSNMSIAEHGYIAHKSEQKQQAE